MAQRKPAALRSAPSLPADNRSGIMALALPVFLWWCRRSRCACLRRSGLDRMSRTVRDEKDTMKQALHQIHVRTHGKGLSEITRPVLDWVRREGIATGVLTVYLRHTSASLTIQENADPDVTHDLEAFFARLVPEDNRLYRHTMEGPDDMPAHIRAALTQTHLAIPVADGRPVLGVWQGIYLFEHRTRPHRRAVVLHLIGD